MMGGRRNKSLRASAGRFLIIFGAIWMASVFVTMYFVGPYLDGETAEGVVVGSEFSASPTSRTGENGKYKTIVEFQVPGTDETFRVVGNGTSTREPKVGGIREVSYRKGDPSGARVVEHKWIPRLFAVAGVGIFASGFLVRRPALVYWLWRRIALRRTGSKLKGSPQDKIRNVSDDVAPPFG